MKSLRRVGLETGQLTDEELIYIDSRIVETVRPQLVGRKLFPIFKTDPGFLTVRGYKMTDMSQATISLYGQTMSRDKTQLSVFNITVPVLHKEWTLWWRDIAAARRSNMPLETREAENAARQVGEEEDKLLITGEYTGWLAYGVEGLATATGRSTQASAGAWPANCITDINAAIAKLEASGHLGPYALIAKPSWLRKLATFITNTSDFYIAKIRDELCKAGIYPTDSLYTSAGGVTNALVVEPSQENFELIVGQDLTNFLKEDEDMNQQGKTFEVLAPRINRPASICEITGLT